MSGAQEFEDIKIVRIIADQVGVPKSDGSEGSGLYAVPFELSAPAPAEWGQLFVRNWDHPPRFTTMHRPGIARVFSKTVVLDGTTVDEVERYHRETLKLALDATNSQYREWRTQQAAAAAQDAERVERHRAHVAETLERITFDE